MTIRAMLDATKAALADMFPTGWTVSVADDEWTAIQVMGERPGGVRAILLPDEFKPFEGGLRGIAGTLSGRLAVQIRRGMDRDESIPLGTLLDAEEKARRALLAIIFQIAGQPDYPADWNSPTSQPHPLLGTFTHEGSGPYKTPLTDLILEHPARQIRWSIPVVLRVANAVRRVDIAADAGE